MRLLAALAALVVSAARAEEAPTYAIVSLLGDRLTVVSHVQPTSTNIGTDHHSELKLATPAIDHAALAATEGALKKAIPEAKTVLLMANDPALYLAQEKVADPDDSAGLLGPQLKTLLSGAKATHLLLLTKIRKDSALVMRYLEGGSGKLEGLGFFVDSNRPMVNRQTGEPYRGFVAPFACFRISLIEVATGRTSSERAGCATGMLPAHSGVSTWEDVPAEQKLAGLRYVLQSEIVKTMPAILAR